MDLSKTLNSIYLERDRRRRKLLSLKNRYFAIIYSQTLKGVPIRKIHKALFDETIESGPKDPDKVLLAMAIKTANKARKYPADAMADMIVALFLRQSNDLARKIVNHDTQERAERDKSWVMDDFVAENRAEGKWFYLASSHDDCAKDHKDWQGKLYVDDKAPAEVIE